MAVWKVHYCICLDNKCCSYFSDDWLVSSKQDIKQNHYYVLHEFLEKCPNFPLVYAREKYAKTFKIITQRILEDESFEFKYRIVETGFETFSDKIQNLISSDIGTRSGLFLR